MCATSFKFTILESTNMRCNFIFFKRISSIKMFKKFNVNMTQVFQSEPFLKFNLSISK